MFYSLPISAKATFYRVVPFVAMTVPPSLIALYGLTVFIIGAVRFWRETQGPISALIDPAALWRATKDAFGLAYMKGGGAGCNYPAREFFTLTNVVSPFGLLRLSARLRRHQHRGVLRSLSRLASAVPIF